MPQTPTHPKIHCTVVSRSRFEFVCRSDDGEEFTVSLSNRSGDGHRADVQAGARVKLYRRLGEDYYRYRFLGG